MNINPLESMRIFDQDTTIVVLNGKRLGIGEGIDIAVEIAISLLNLFNGGVVSKNLCVDECRFGAVRHITHSKQSILIVVEHLCEIVSM